MSKYTEAFDSLKSDEKTKRERAARVLSAHRAEQVSARNRDEQAVEPSSPRKRARLGRRGVALVTAAAVLGVSVAVAVPVGLTFGSGGLQNAISKLKDTFVDMDGVAAFGTWSAPDESSPKGRIANVVNVRRSALSDEIEDNDDESGDGDKVGIISGDWSDEDRYDWESDYDWDPAKANVLIAIDEDGKVKEVVYERTNGRGQVRQDTLGNAAMVYVSDSFTYIMYVSDDEWEYWTQSYSPSANSGGFACFHNERQTVVIHNATGKVYPLKDVIPQVNELSGATNYTLFADPMKNDVIYIRPLYGRWIPLWFNVIYDEQADRIRYDLILPIDYAKRYGVDYNVLAVRRDKYGQQYLLEGYNDDIVNSIFLPRVTAGTVELPEYEFVNGVLVFKSANGMMMGSDGRMYAFDEGKLKVFGEGYTLSPVEPNTYATLEGVSNDWSCYQYFYNSGAVYRLQGEFLYSAYGQVWNVDGDGAIREFKKFTGSFPNYADEMYMIGGEILAFSEARLGHDGKTSLHGKLVHISFDNNDGDPAATIKHIIDAAYIEVGYTHRMIAIQAADPFETWEGLNQTYLITVTDGVPHAELIAEGYGGTVGRPVRPIIEPVVLS